VITIYYQPNKSRRRETAFFNHLIKYFPHAEIVSSAPSVTDDYPDRYVDSQQLVEQLERDVLLPERKRRNCIEVLKSSRQLLRPSSRITVDVIIEEDGTRSYWEFHEQQHRRLTITRNPKLYSSDGSFIEVPRYLQRLVFDVWRVQNLRPFTIVWYDWFKAHMDSFDPRLNDGFSEFYIQGKFNFGSFCQLV